MLQAILLLGLAYGRAESTYERDLINWGLAQNQAVIETEPEGKVVEAIITAREDVFSKSDPWPNFLNIFHGRTKEHVVTREVLLKPGEVWSSEKADETERNLRALVIIAVAKVVPVKSPNGGVIVLVVTKDRWSFRANWNYRLVGDVLEYLDVPITEVNLLGRAIEVTVEPELRQDTFNLTEQVVWRRLGNSRILLNEGLGVVINRFNKQIEGSIGTLQVSRPLITLDQRWGFNVRGDWNLRRVRLFRKGTIWNLGYPNEDMPTTLVPYVYDSSFLRFLALGSLRFGMGTQWRTDVTAGVIGYSRQAKPPASLDVPADVKAWFQKTRLPLTEDVVSLYAAALLFSTTYVQLQGIETFGLTEDYQIGPRFVVAAQWAMPVTTSRFVQVGASLRWRFLFGDNLLTLQSAAAARFTSQDTFNQHYALQLLNFWPAFRWGRLVSHVVAEFRENDLNNNTIVLGGGLGLRGTASGAFTGRNMFLGNFEFRSRPITIQTFMLGCVLFYDVGSAFDTRPTLTHTVGLGLRLLIPQFNTVTIRLDFGWILGSNSGLFSADRFSSSFGQVTQLGQQNDRLFDFFNSPL